MMNKKIIISSVLGILFIIIAVLVSLDLTTSLDNFVYNAVTIKMNNGLTNLHKVFTFFGSTLFIVLLSLFLVVMFWIKKQKKCSLIVAFVIIVSTIANTLIKHIIRRQRPTVLALVTEKSFSFPSGHTMAAVSLYGILLYLVLKSNLNKKLKIICSIFLVLMPILVGISRIYLGAHFATDVIGGALLSLTLLLVEIHYIAKKEWI